MKRPAWLNGEAGVTSVDVATSGSHEVGGTTGALTPSEMGCHEKICGSRGLRSDI